MSCRRSSRLAGLAAGGDLAGRELAAWRRHSASCAACRQTERSLRDSLAALRSMRPYEFGEAERAEMRQAVWRAIEEERVRGQAHPLRLRWRPLAAAAALALAVLATWTLLRNGETAPASVEGIAARPTAPVVVEESTSSPAGRAPVARLTAPHPRLPSHRSAPAAAGPRAPSRLEIATPDPDVRIIWLYDSGDADAETPADAALPEEVS